MRERGQGVIRGIKKKPKQLYSTDCLTSAMRGIELARRAEIPLKKEHIVYSEFCNIDVVVLWAETRLMRI